MSTILPLENSRANGELNSVDYKTQGFIDAGKVNGSHAAFGSVLKIFIHQLY